MRRPYRTPPARGAKGLSAADGVTDPLVRQLIEELQRSMQEIAAKFATEGNRPVPVTKLRVLVPRVDRHHDQIRFFERSLLFEDGELVRITPERIAGTVGAGEVTATTTGGGTTTNNFYNEDITLIESTSGWLG